MLETFRLLTEAAPNAPAFIDGGTAAVTTRAALRSLAAEMAAQLRTAELAAGDLLAVQLPNSPDFVVSFLAAIELGLTIVPIDRDAPEIEVATILGHFGARGLIYNSGAKGQAVATRLSTRSVAARPAHPPSTRLLKLTSGSTGKPKGIATSEANLVADCVNICATMQIGPEDRNLGAIPFSHSYGFSNLVTPLLVQGTAVVISNDYLPQSIIDLSNRHHCTIVPAIPMVFEHLTSLPAGDGDFETVRTFLSAGAPLPASTSRRFRERFGRDIHTFYGCSECGGITYDREGAAVERGTVGAAMENVLLEERASRLVVRSDSVALGYLHDASTFEEFEPGTFTTDDLIESAGDGELILAGRAGELINTAGKKVNPREVEQIIQQMDGVRQVKVYGEPAGARGEVVAAAVVAEPDVTREMVREFCRQRLSSHKVPRIVKLIESIPVDDRGKVRRSALALLSEK
jgi:acyl-CoA synthetase (AMP-forming)/AMP-acid ligase II